MQLYSEGNNYKLFQGDMLDLLEVIDENSIDAIITDPPYELNFMGKGWDNSGIAFRKDTWEKCLKALKPGGYLLAFGGSRTHHRIACAIEDAGFEIRDCIMRIYGSGFPKSMNLGKSIESKLLNGTANPKDFKDLDGEKVETGNWGISKMVKEQGARPSDYTEDKHLRVDKVNYKSELGKKYEGRGTALKPAYEPIIVARKPCEGSCTDNVIKYGVGGINIDECRVGNEERTQFSGRGQSKSTVYSEFPQENAHYETVTGRFPANTILTYGDDDKEEVCSGFPDTKSGSKMSFGSVRKAQPDNTYQLGFTKHENSGQTAPDNYGDSGSAARYFYCAKASKRDRDEGLGTQTLVDIILTDNNGKTWKGENIIRDEKLVNVDMGLYLKSDTEEYEIPNKEDIDLSIMLYMRNTIEKYLNECKSITKMGINLTTIYQILNWLAPLNIKENTLDAKKYDELYTSHVESAENGDLLIATIREKTESAHDVENAVLKMQLKIREKEGRNEHCTVKPTSLMQYLVRLVTPNGGTVLDPFNGSGSTGKAVMYENKDRNKNYKYIGIELTEEYLPIAQARIEYVTKQEQPPILFSDFAGYDEKNFTD